MSVSVALCELTFNKLTNLPITECVIALKLDYNEIISEFVLRNALIKTYLFTEELQFVIRGSRTNNKTKR